jgi:hypothetical protein
MYANFRMRRAHSTDIAVLAASNNVFVMFANFTIEKNSLHATCIAFLLATAMTGHQLPPFNVGTTPVSGIHV